MIIVVYSPAMVRQGFVEDIISCSWIRRFRTAGECNLQVPFRAENEELLRVGNIVMQLGGREAMQIIYRKLEKNSTNMDTISIRATSLFAWTGQRVNIAGLDSEKYTPQGIIQKLFRENVTASSVAARRIPNVVLRSRSAYSQTAVDYSAEPYSELQGLIEEQLEDSDMGCLIDTDPDTGIHTFDFVEATDKTETAPIPCIFSVEFGSLGAQNFVYSVENYKSTAYVQGGDEGIVEVVNNNYTGLERFEVGVSATDIQLESTNPDNPEETITLTEAQVRSKLRKRGKDELKKSYQLEQTFEGTANQISALQYKIDYDIGDRVTCICTNWNVKVDATITQITETYSPTGLTIAVVFGDGTPTLKGAIMAAIKTRS